MARVGADTAQVASVIAKHRHREAHHHPQPRGERCLRRSLTTCRIGSSTPSTSTQSRVLTPAASPFDKRLTELLGLEAFEIYQVELPPGAESVDHNHVDDGVDDLYIIIRGSGWVVVDDDPDPVTPGDFVAVTNDSQRFLRAGDHGLVFVAVCG